MTPQAETSVPPELLERILALAGNDMILIGGQALAFWAAYYGTPTPTIAITKDVDFIGTKADVERLARGLDARSVLPRKGDMTLLVGPVAMWAAGFWRISRLWRRATRTNLLGRLP